MSDVFVRIQTRRAVLAAQIAQAQAQYAELEQTLHALDRQLCAMHGGLQELDALLESSQQRDDRRIPHATAHIAAISGLLAEYQAANDPHLHTQAIETHLTAAHDELRTWLLETGASCADSPPS